MNEKINNQMLDIISKTDDPKKLRQIAKNASDKQNDLISKAAKLRLYSILPSENFGTLEYDIWQSIYALEGTLSDERGKTIRLARTRQKIGRVKEHQTVVDLVLGKQSEGFDMLIERGMPELTFEAVALKHTSRFSEEVLTAARTRLESASIDLADIL